MDISIALTPYWYDPATDPKVPEALRATYAGVRLKLAPITFPQRADVQATPNYFTSDEGRVLGMYRAGCMAVREIEGITLNGRKAEWPADRDWIDDTLLFFAGTHVMRASNTSTDQTKN